ncbi:F0F1 ATP synthase subunit delta [Salirhabdus sp. Marseille-P4669]|uniref:F0F1 ATP synthase subunit delta n=1 Tax=Salirhabdus sp. Marseille-P4669 TaxID=2042310 RepID=UPI000C7DD5CE|nr:F0F1 ATP synthase subunit delta [Salirhabdus sp. Marseille-P4669]
MSHSVVANRYAVALFQLGQEKSLLATLEEELRVVREVFETNSNITTFLNHPAVSTEQKKAIVKDAFQHASKELINTLSLMIDRRRAEEIPAMASAFVGMVNEFNGVQEAEVYSVRELSDDEKESLQKVFAEKLGLNALRIQNIVDTSLLGGLKLKIGNRIYDGSVSGKLERIERNLVSVNNR